MGMMLKTSALANISGMLICTSCSSILHIDLELLQRDEVNFYTVAVHYGSTSAVVLLHRNSCYAVISS
jgi:hypothetical protein